jgi:hypothetical protein
MKRLDIDLAELRYLYMETGFGMPVSASEVVMMSTSGHS